VNFSRVVVFVVVLGNGFGGTRIHVNKNNTTKEIYA
jgi:hypothetical protein